MSFYAMCEIVVIMKREIVAHILEAVYFGEAECGDKRQFHVEDAVFVIGSEHKIAVGIAYSLTYSLLIRKENREIVQSGFRIGDIGMVEPYFGHLRPCTHLEMGTTGIADIEYLGLAWECLQSADDIDASDTRIDDAKRK